MAVATRIEATFKGCGAIAFWGLPMVRPYDSFFRLVRARASGGDIVLELEQEFGGASELEISAPEEVHVASDSLTVTRATTLRLGATVVQSRDGGEPALVLR